MREDYEDAEQLLGDLVEELRVLRTYLADAIRKQQADPDGGYEVTYGKITKIRLHRDVVAELTERIGKLERIRDQISRDGDDEAQVRAALLVLMDSIRGEGSDGDSGGNPTAQP
jgi:hypothetical protein